jgi:hypothetical protein
MFVYEWSAHEQTTIHVLDSLMQELQYSFHFWASVCEKGTNELNSWYHMRVPETRSFSCFIYSCSHVSSIHPPMKLLSLSWPFLFDLKRLHCTQGLECVINVHVSKIFSVLQCGFEPPNHFFYVVVAMWPMGKMEDWEMTKSWWITLLFIP